MMELWLFGSFALLPQGEPKTLFLPTIMAGIIPNDLANRLDPR
jgi:hypothetical protein